MRCEVALAVALGACEFHATSGASQSPPPLDAPAPTGDDATPPIDATPPEAADATTDAASPAAFCDPTDPHLVACYEFEGDAKDDSTNHINVKTDHVTFPSVGKAGKAMLFFANSTADAADSDALNVPALTIEAWINPSQLPSSGHAVIVDVDRQYALQIGSDGSVTCVLVNAPFDPPPTTERVAVNQWTHVACTYDVTAAVVYVNGVPTTPVIGGPSLGTAGDTGLSISSDNNATASSRSRMIGLIDELRLMNVARSRAQICADAGRSPCP
jgi:hypothetical protein